MVAAPKRSIVSIQQLSTKARIGY